MCVELVELLKAFMIDPELLDTQKVGDNMFIVKHLTTNVVTVWSEHSSGLFCAQPSVKG